MNSLTKRFPFVWVIRNDEKNRPDTRACSQIKPIWCTVHCFLTASDHLGITEQFDELTVVNVVIVVPIIPQAIHHLEKLSQYPRIYLLKADQ